MEGILSKAVQEYRDLISEAREAGMTYKARRFEDELEGFRKACELLLSEAMIEKIFPEA